MTRPPAPPPPLRVPGRVTGRGPGYVIVRVATPDGGHIALSGPDLAWVLRGLATAVSPLYGQACVVALDEEGRP